MPSEFPELSKTMHSLARALAATALGLTLVPGLAQAKVRIAVDLDAQTIHVEAKSQTFDWKVSSGKSGYDTPTGTAGVLWMDKDHHSDEYDQAPMPNAIFFAPGYAIHGVAKSQWGHKGSHGCIRLPVAKSAILWDLVKAEGGAEVTITGASPETMASVRAKARANAAVASNTTPNSSRNADAVAPGAVEAQAAAANDDGYAYAPERRGRTAGLFGGFY
jgi:hypothetical protein